MEKGRIAKAIADFHSFFISLSRRLQTGSS